MQLTKHPPYKFFTITEKNQGSQKTFIATKTNSGNIPTLIVSKNIETIYKEIDIHLNTAE